MYPSQLYNQKHLPAIAKKQFSMGDPVFDVYITLYIFYRFAASKEEEDQWEVHSLTIKNCVQEDAGSFR